MRVAARSRDFTVAQLAVEAMADWLPAEDAGTLEQEIASARGRRLARRLTRLREMLGDIRRGLSRPDRERSAPTLEEYTNEAAGFLEQQTVDVLLPELAKLVTVAEQRAQAKRLWSGPDADMLHFAVRVSAAMRSEAVIEPLGRLLAALHEREQRVFVARELCNTRQAAAWPIDSRPPAR